MTIDTDVVITINLSELVNIRSVSLDTEMTIGQIEDLANELRLTLTWDTLYGMVDDAILDIWTDLIQIDLIMVRYPLLLDGKLS